MGGAFPRTAHHFVHGVEGPVTIVPASVAAWLQREFDLDQVRIRVRGEDPERDAVLIALATAALGSRGSGVGTFDRNPSEPVAPSPVMTTSDVADELDLEQRTVVKAIADGRLRATRHGREWRIDRTDFEKYRAARSA